MTPYILLSTFLILAALAIATRADAADPSKGRVIADLITATRNCQDKIPQERSFARYPWRPHSASYWAAERILWQKRLNACRAVLKERARQWNWQAWLPAHWHRVGTCETQLNWRHSNSSYQGAFGFAISSWDGYKLPGYPDEAWQATPWQQYQVALEIYKRFGMSGWGCKG